MFKTSSYGALFEIIVKIDNDPEFDDIEYEILSIKSKDKISKEDLTKELIWLEGHFEMGWGIGMEIWGDDIPQESGKYLVTGRMHGEWCGYESPEFEQEFQLDSSRKL